jgi:hypothetical protein
MYNFLATRLPTQSVNQSAKLPPQDAEAIYLSSSFHPIYPGEESKSMSMVFASPTAPRTLLEPPSYSTKARMGAVLANQKATLQFH